MTNIEELFSIEILRTTSSNIIHFYSPIGTDKMNYSLFKKNEDTILKGIYERIISDKYVFKPYLERLLIKNRNSYPRCLSIPTLSDRVCLKVLDNAMKYYFSQKLEKQNIPQFHIKQIKQRFSYFDSFIKIDIKNFFNCIDHGILMEKIGAVIKEPEICSLINNAIKTPTGFEEEQNEEGLPQGISISNYCAHIYMSAFDNKWENYPSIHYSRYVDDILILFDSETYKSEELYEEIKKDLSKLDLFVHSGKFDDGKIKETSFSYLGYETYYDEKNLKVCMGIPKKSIQKLEEKLLRVITSYKKSNKNTSATNRLIHGLNLIITGSISKKATDKSDLEKRYGWLFFYSQLDNVSKLYHLDSLIERKLEKILAPLADIKTETIFSQLKSFVTAYYEIRFNAIESTYIFRPDDFEKDDKEKFLVEVMAYSKSYLREKDDRIDKLFRKHIYDTIIQQEKDIIERISS